ncbi:MAG: hypothetical protein H6514_20715 [Acidimicrobiaceae bacterium]|nr:hypothetical protein [Acidimicrobiaceae bacterium]
MLDWTELDVDDRRSSPSSSRRRVFPVLTHSQWIPHRSSPASALSLAAMVGDPDTGERRFARVKVPSVFPRLIALSDGLRFVPAEQVIAAHMHLLCQGAWWWRVRRVPRHPQRRPHPRRGRGRRSARCGRARAPTSPLRSGRAPRGAVGHERRDGGTARARARPRARRRVVSRHLARPHVPVPARRDRPARAEGPPVAARHGGAHRRGRRGRAEHLLGDPRASAARAPPLRELRQQRRELHRAGGR